MMALALCEDSIRLRSRRDAIIDSLGTLPDKIRAVRQTFRHESMCFYFPSLHCCYGQSPSISQPPLDIYCRPPRPCLAAQVLKLDAKMLELAEQLKGEQSLLVFGRGYNYATALEAALKVGSWATCCPNSAQLPSDPQMPWTPHG